MDKSFTTPVESQIVKPNFSNEVQNIRLSDIAALSKKGGMSQSLNLPDLEIEDFSQQGSDKKQGKEESTGDFEADDNISGASTKEGHEPDLGGTQNDEGREDNLEKLPPSPKIKA